MDIQRLSRIEEALKKYVSQGKIAGASAAVIKDCKTAYRTDVGLADIENNRKMDENTIFRLFSLSKPVTSTAVMILFERGELDLNHPLKWYLPQFEKMTVSSDDMTAPADKDITISHLLNMTSGIPYPSDDSPAGRKMGELFWNIEQEYLAGKPASTQDYAKRAAGVPLAFMPGDKWEYGFSADILGAVVEKVSGMRYSEFLKKEIFSPLGMNDTGFFIPKDKLDNFAQLYDFSHDERPDIFKGFFLGVGNYDIPPAFESGGAGLVSTLSDYGKFAAMLANGGELNGVRILGRKTLDFMASDRLTPHQKRSMTWDSNRGYGYGNLLRVLTDPSEAATNGDLGEFGWDGWAGCYLTVDRKENMTFQLFMQKCGGDLDITRNIRAIVYSAL